MSGGRDPSHWRPWWEQQLSTQSISSVEATTTHYHNRTQTHTHMHTHACTNTHNYKHGHAHAHTHTTASSPTQKTQNTMKCLPKDIYILNLWILLESCSIVEAYRDFGLKPTWKIRVSGSGSVYLIREVLQGSFALMLTGSTRLQQRPHHFQPLHFPWVF